MRSKRTARRLDRLFTTFHLLRHTFDRVSRNNRCSVDLDILSIDPSNKNLSIALRFDDIRPANIPNVLMVAISSFQDDHRSKGVGLSFEGSDDRGNLVLNVSID